MHASYIIRRPMLTEKSTIGMSDMNTYTFEVARGRWQVAEDGRLTHAQTGQPPTGHELIWRMWSEADPTWRPAWLGNGTLDP